MSSSRSIVHFALLAVVLVLAAGLADLAFTKLVASSPALEAGRLARLAAGTDPNEIPIFGPSKAESDYIPEVLGPKFYNYGLASTSQDVANYLIAMELKKPSRQPIILDVPQIAIREIGDPRNYLLLSARADTRHMMRRVGLWKWYYAVPGLRYFGSWDWYVKGLLTDRITLTKRIVRGYVHNLDDLPWSAEEFASDVARRRRQPPMGWYIDPRQTADLVALMHSAPHRQFVLVLSPLHKSFLEGATGEPEFRKHLDALLHNAPNASLIDLTRTSYPDRLFLNTGHLNEDGATVFSMQLRKELEHLRIIASPPPS